MEAARQTAGRTGCLWWSPIRAHTDHTRTRRFVGWRQLSPSEPGHPVRGRTGTDARAREGTRAVRSHGPPLGSSRTISRLGRVGRPSSLALRPNVVASCRGRGCPPIPRGFLGLRVGESSRLYMPRAASPLPRPNPGAEGTSGARRFKSFAVVGWSPPERLVIPAAQQTAGCWARPWSSPTSERTSGTRTSRLVACPEFQPTEGRPPGSRQAGHGGANALGGVTCCCSIRSSAGVSGVRQQHFTTAGLARWLRA